MTDDLAPTRDAAPSGAPGDGGPVDGSAEPGFDRVARLSAEVLRAPLSLVSLIGDPGRFTSRYIAPADSQQERQAAALEKTCCSQVVASREALLIEDAGEDPRVATGADLVRLGLRSSLGVPLITPRGEVIGALCVADSEARTWSPEQIRLLEDLAAPVIAEIELRRELRERERMLARFKALTEHSSDVVTLVAADGVIEYHSAAAERLFGYASGELVGRNVFGMIHPEDVAAVRAAFRALVEEPAVVHRTEFRFPHRDGSWRLVEARGSNCLSDPALRGMIVTSRDVTARKLDQEELRNARDAADAANREKSEMLSRMSHELRTPLNAILGFAQLLELEVSGEGDRESVQQILRAGRHLVALVDHVLDVARIEAGKLSLSVEPVLVSEVIEESLNLVRHIARRKDVAIEVHHDGYPEELVWADEQRLKQVLLNLLSNAIKYNRERDGLVTVTSRPVGTEKLRIEVRDTGRGVPAEAVERLFTPFDRLDASRSGVEGTGLGLALSKGLVEAMGGTIGCESEEGVGSTFWVELLRPPLENVRRAPAAALEGPPTTHTLLLVEDNLANARLITHVLLRRPHVRLLTAGQGSMALELARAHHPDLILLDLNLPDISGAEVLRRIRDDPALWDIPVVTMSGGAPASAVEEVLTMGATTFLTKPFELHELLRAVDDNL